MLSSTLLDNRLQNRKKGKGGLSKPDLKPERGRRETENVKH